MPGSRIEADQATRAGHHQNANFFQVLKQCRQHLEVGLQVTSNCYNFRTVVSTLHFEMLLMYGDMNSLRQP